MSSNKIITTLCTILKDGKLLLGMKKRGFGAGKWNGFGGKVKDGESIEESVRRETKEEAGITIKKLEKIGVLNFLFSETGEEIEVHMFCCKEFSGEPVETEEMKPEWFSIDKLPYDSMWPDDRIWMPLLLEGKKFKGKFVFDKNTNIINYNIEEIAEMA